MSQSMTVSKSLIHCKVDLASAPQKTSGWKQIEDKVDIKQ